MIDWSDPKCLVTENFSVKECLNLHLEDRLANESDGLTDSDKRNLMALCHTLELIRAKTGFPLSIHSMYRSPEYSVKVGGGAHDVHTLGEACDFDCEPHLSCDAVKAMLLPALEELGIRMENNGHGASWVHVDIHEVIHKRYFDP